MIPASWPSLATMARFTQPRDHFSPVPVIYLQTQKSPSITPKIRGLFTLCQICTHAPRKTDNCILSQSGWWWLLSFRGRKRGGKSDEWCSTLIPFSAAAGTAIRRQQQPRHPPTSLGPCPVKWGAHISWWWNCNFYAKYQPTPTIWIA